MVNKWKIIPVIALCIFVLIIVPKVEAAKYIMTYLYGSGNYFEMISERGNNFNEVSPSYFDINENGSLKLNYIDKSFVSEMKNKGIKVVPFLSNHWNRDIGRKAVQNYENLASEIVEAVKENELDGVNVDVENLTEMDRKNYTKLVKTLKEKMPGNKVVAVSVAANPTSINVGWQGSYDYKELAKYADYIMIMTYDEHYEGGTTGPVASIEFVKKSLEYALENVDKDKVVLGIPLYGRYWNVETGVGGEAISLKQMDEILGKYDSKISLDEESQSPKALITINTGDELPKIGGKILLPGKYEFWYENEESIAQKLDLIEKYDIKGVGMWKIGLETTGIWTTIVDTIKEIFSDVNLNYWAYEYIEFVKEKGLMIGNNNGEFKPEDSLTRAEFSTIIARVIVEKNIKIKPTIVSEGNFVDVTDHWAENEIAKLRDLGLINGYENNEFRPDNVITRAEVCTIISRLLESTEVSGVEGLKSYLDLEKTHWAYEEIAKLSELGIIKGYENGKFEPKNPVKRSEIAKIIQKMCEKIT